MNKWHLCLSLGLLFGWSSFAVAATGGKIVARGLGFTVKQAELDSAYRQFVLSQAVSGSDVPTTMADFFRKQVLDELVLEKITFSRATAGDRGQAYIQAMEGYNDLRLQYLSESSFTLKIQSMGMTTNAYRLYMQNKALTQQVLKREMKSKTMVREVQIQEFYNENMDLWKVPESADVEHILLAKIDVSTGRRLNPDERAAKQAVAAKVFAKARAGVDFAQLAKEYSEDMTTKNSGGKFQMIRGLTDPKLATKVFAMRINRVEMVGSDFGHHIVRVTKKIPAKTKKISEVAKHIREHLHMRNYINALPGYVAQLRRQAVVRFSLE